MEQKYTAKQWAEIEGGHAITEDKKPQYSFVRDLNESKMFRTRQQFDSSDRDDMADFAYINILTLLLLSRFEQTVDYAESYAKSTVSFRNFNNYRQSGTDLYTAIVGLKDEYNLNTQRLLQFLTSISQGREYPNTAGYLLQLEKQLNISDSNYKAVRRLVGNLDQTTPNQKKIAVTRLLQYYRTKAIRSELYAPLKDLAKIAGLEIHGAEVAEKKPNAALKAAAAAAAVAGGFALGRAFGRRIAGG